MCYREFRTPVINDKVEGLENSGNYQDNKKLWMGLSIIWNAVLMPRIRFAEIYAVKSIEKPFIVGHFQP